MGRSYPVWNIINSCAYQGNKSYGVKETGDVTVRVGTSAGNSHPFVKHVVTHRKHDNGDREYRFYVDNVCIKRALLRKDAVMLEQLPPKNN
jgi:hypothetical protein